MTEGGPWVHHGLTSSDVLDTATAVQLRDASALLLSRVERLFEVVRDRALENRRTVMVGRTHGIWAEPTTMGLKLASWAFELERDHARLTAAAKSVAVGKVSGAVGTYAHLPPQVEQHVCAGLDLTPEPAATQVVARRPPRRVSLHRCAGGRLAGAVCHRGSAFAAERGWRGSRAVPLRAEGVLGDAA